MASQNGEGTEENGFKLEDSKDMSAGLDSLRMKLRGSTVPVEGPPPLGDTEPSYEQLLATGEAGEEEPEPEGLGEQEEPGEEAETPVSLVVRDEKGKELSVTERIERGLRAGMTKKELIATGLSEGSVNTIASRLKAKQQAQVVGGKPSARTSSGMPIFAHGSPPEAIIESIAVPDVADGQGFAFEQGIKFGMSLITIGIRMAQEMSAIGVQQSKPIIDMAKSMREGEAVAAKNAAGEAAMEAAGMVQQSLMPILANIQRGGGDGGVDPVKAMMVRTMEPIMQRLMGNVFGRLVPGTQPLQITEGQGKVDGWSRRSE